MRKITPSSGFCWYLKWLSTLLLLLGGLLAAANIVPINFAVGALGMIGWAIVGFIWHDRSLIVLNAVSATLAILAYVNF